MGVGSHVCGSFEAAAKVLGGTFDVAEDASETIGPSSDEHVVFDRLPLPAELKPWLIPMNAVGLR
jgi:hypothetical protein